MKVIFIEDYRVEEVSDGYARNFLIPRKLVIQATPKALAAAEKQAEKKKAEIEQKRSEMKALADKLSAQEINITTDAGEEGKLFGSVTTADIAQAVKNEMGLELDKKKIIIQQPIKMLGEYTVLIKLFHGISTDLKIKVTAKQ